MTSADGGARRGTFLAGQWTRAVRADAKETAALWQVNAALREAEWGETASAKQGVRVALALSRGRDVKVAAALALARIGDAPRATARVGELEKGYPANTMLKLYWPPTINAAVELNKGNSSQALVHLEDAAPYELGGGVGFIIICTRHTCVAKPTCWDIMELPQLPSFRSGWITEAAY